MNIDKEFGADIGLVTIACNAVGYALKKSPAPDWVIPFALPIVGAVLHGLVTDRSVRSCLLGAALGWTAVGAHQAAKQIKEQSIETNETNP